jgi:hypothetical protein
MKRRYNLFKTSGCGAQRGIEPNPLKTLEASSGIVDDAINKEEEPDQLRGG